MLACQTRWICGTGSSSCFARAQCNCGLRDVGNTTGQSARPYTSARFRKCPAAGQGTPSTLESAIELRLGEKRADSPEEVIGQSSYLDFSLQCLELLERVGAQTFALSAVDFVAFDSVVEGLRQAADCSSL